MTLFVYDYGHVYSLIMVYEFCTLRNYYKCVPCVSWQNSRAGTDSEIRPKMSNGTVCEEMLVVGRAHRFLSYCFRRHHTQKFHSSINPSLLWLFGFVFFWPPLRGSPFSLYSVSLSLSVDPQTHYNPPTYDKKSAFLVFLLLYLLLQYIHSSSIQSIMKLCIAALTVASAAAFAPSKQVRV